MNTTPRIRLGKRLRTNIHRQYLCTHIKVCYRANVTHALMILKCTPPLALPCVVTPEAVSGIKHTLQKTNFVAAFDNENPRINKEDLFS